MAVHIMEGEIFREAINAPEVRAIMDERAVVESWLAYEGILAEVQGRLGIIPASHAREIKSKATLGSVSFARIIEINKKTRLASVATLRALAEVCEGGAGEYVHFGACSPELFENTLAHRLGLVMDVFEKDLVEVEARLLRLAGEHKGTLMIERSHGQQGTPTTFGLVAAIWAAGVATHRDRIADARKRILVGSLKGPYANCAAYHMVAGDRCLEMEKQVLEHLGLRAVPIATTRHMERFAEFMNLLALMAMTFEKICDDIFVQQRNEIGELEEPFDTQHQIGSSTLPHKRNPVLCEGVLAWCKKIRSNAGAFADTHMRESHDITGFYIEDLVIPESCMLMGSVLSMAKTIFARLRVDKERMRRNLDISRGLALDESLMFALARKTGKKQTAHRLLHEAAMVAFERQASFAESILENAAVREFLSRDEIERLLAPENYIGLNDRFIEGALERGVQLTSSPEKQLTVEAFMRSRPWV